MPFLYEVVSFLIKLMLPIQKKKKMFRAPKGSTTPIAKQRFQ